MAGNFEVRVKYRVTKRGWLKRIKSIDSEIEKLTSRIKNLEISKIQEELVEIMECVKDFNNLWGFIRKVQFPILNYMGRDAREDLFRFGSKLKGMVLILKKKKLVGDDELNTVSW